MRDLTRANSKHPACEELSAAGYTVYTPMTWRIFKAGSRKERRRVPVIHDLLFVESTRAKLDPYVNRVPTLQYRFMRGGRQGDVMTVSDAEMQRFIRATAADPEPVYFKPTEITASMIGKRIRIFGGALDGMEGHLLSIRGMRKKRMIVELPGMLTAAIEVNPEYIELI